MYYIYIYVYSYEYQKEVADIGDNYNEYINYWKLISIVHIQIILLSILCLLFPFRVSYQASLNTYIYIYIYIYIHI